MKRSIWISVILLSGSLLGSAADSEPTEKVNLEQKLASSKRLVLNGVKHIQKVGIENACNDFIRSKIWRDGELFVAVFLTNGTCLTHGDDDYLIWKNIESQKGQAGGPLIKDMLSIGAKGGRVTYEWNNAYRSSYVKTITKDNVTYILNCGFFPEDNEFTTKQVVKSAVKYFYQNGKDATFSLISNPTGPFSKGDIYMFAFDFDGVNVAHGNNPALTGQNLIDLVDSRGKPIVKGLINVARTQGKGWFDYYWKHTAKRSYVEKVVDEKTKVPYFISSGYYPDINLKVVENHVKKAIGYLKTHGAKNAFNQFSNLVGEFGIGGLGIFVFDYEGNCLANGINPAYVGQNLLKLEDDRGRLYVRDLIKAAREKEKVLLSFSLFNATAIAYLENIETPDGKFIIGSQFFPSSRVASTRTLVASAVAHLEANSPEKAFDSFSTRGTEYSYGDLSIFVYDAQGTRLVNGFHKTRIWQNFLKTTDQQGKAVIEEIINIGLKGGGWSTYQIRNARRHVYVKPVEKKVEGGKIKNYIVGSGYFL